MAEKILPMRATIQMRMKYKPKVNNTIPIIQHVHAVLMDLYENNRFDLPKIPPTRVAADPEASVDAIYMEIQQLEVDNSMMAHIRFYIEYDMEPNQILQSSNHFYEMQKVEQAINFFLEKVILNLHAKSVFSFGALKANKPSFFIETTWDETQYHTHEEQLAEMYARRQDGINFATIVTKETLEYVEPEPIAQEVIQKISPPPEILPEESEEEVLHLPFDPNNVTAEDMPIMEQYFGGLDLEALRAFAQGINVRGARTRPRRLLVGDIIDQLIYS